MYFNTAKVGDRVWSFRNGWGTIENIESGKEVSYPIRVKFDNDTKMVYTLEGKELKTDNKQTLFYEEIKYTIPKNPKKKYYISIIINDNILCIGRSVLKVTPSIGSYSANGCVQTVALYDNENDAQCHSRNTVGVAEITI